MCPFSSALLCEIAVAEKFLMEMVCVDDKWMDKYKLRTGVSTETEVAVGTWYSGVTKASGAI